MTDDILRKLRAITEEDVAAALDGAYFKLPITNTAEALEMINRVIDLYTGKLEG